MRTHRGPLTGPRRVRGAQRSWRAKPRDGRALCGRRASSGHEKKYLHIPSGPAKEQLIEFGMVNGDVEFSSGTVATGLRSFIVIVLCPCIIIILIFLLTIIAVTRGAARSSLP